MQNAEHEPHCNRLAERPRISLTAHPDLAYSEKRGETDPLVSFRFPISLPGRSGHARLRLDECPRDDRIVNPRSIYSSQGTTTGQFAASILGVYCLDSP